MPKFKSSWYRPPSLRYIAHIEEVRRKDAEYKEWLARQRGWTNERIEAYLQLQRAVFPQQ